MVFVEKMSLDDRLVQKILEWKMCDEEECWTRKYSTNGETSDGYFNIYPRMTGYSNI